jgi:FMN-dependent NADH-azoreductase
MNTLDFVEPYLRAIFNFVGITDITFINAQPMDVSLDIRKAAMQKSIADARTMVKSGEWNIQQPISIPVEAKPAPITE